MANETNLHGISLDEVIKEPPSIQTVGTSTIALIADCDALTKTAGSFVVQSLGEFKALLVKDSTKTKMEGYLEQIFMQAKASVICIPTAKAAASADAPATPDDVINRLKEAQSQHGKTPKIICGPDYFNNKTNIDSVTKKVCEVLRSVLVIDVAGEYKDAAKTIADYTSSRIYPVFPKIKLSGGVEAPASPSVCGLIVAVDQADGFWQSPSNKTLAGVEGLSEPISWGLSDSETKANDLNNLGIATIIREGGFRLWGNRTRGGASTELSDKKNQFLCVRRTTDAINDSIVKSHMWALDRSITSSHLAMVLTSVNNYLRDLKAAGAILGGEAWADPADNSASGIEKGELTIHFDYGPQYPCERLKFKSHLTSKYIETIFE